MARQTPVIKREGMKCPECSSEDIVYDPVLKELVCRRCGLVIELPPREKERLISFRPEVPVVEVDAPVGVHVLESRVDPGKGYRLVLSQKRALQEMVTGKGERGSEIEFEATHRFWNPVTRGWENRRVVEVIMDASIPEKDYAAYRYYSRGLGDEDKIVLLLGIVGSSPTTAISQVTGIRKSTLAMKRLRSLSPWSVSNPKGKDFIRTIRPPSELRGTVEFRGKPYRTGRLFEATRILTKRGERRFKELLKRFPPFDSWEPEPTPIVPIPERGIPLPGPVYGAFGEKLSEVGGVLQFERPHEITEEEFEWYSREWRRPPNVDTLVWDSFVRRLRSEYIERTAALKPASRIKTVAQMERRIIPYSPGPLAVYESAVEREIMEHPWLTVEEAERIVRDHAPVCEHPSYFESPTGEKFCMVCGERV